MNEESLSWEKEVEEELKISKWWAEQASDEVDEDEKRKGGNITAARNKVEAAVNNVIPDKLSLSQLKGISKYGTKSPKSEIEDIRRPDEIIASLHPDLTKRIPQLTSSQREQHQQTSMMKNTIVNMDRSENSRAPTMEPMLSTSTSSTQKENDNETFLYVSTTDMSKERTSEIELDEINLGSSSVGLRDFDSKKLEEDPNIGDDDEYIEPQIESVDNFSDNENNSNTSSFQSPKMSKTKLVTNSDKNECFTPSPSSSSSWSSETAGTETNVQKNLHVENNPLKSIFDSAVKASNSVNKTSPLSTASSPPLTSSPLYGRSSIPTREEFDDMLFGGLMIDRIELSAADREERTNFPPSPSKSFSSSLSPTSTSVYTKGVNLRDNNTSPSPHCDLSPTITTTSSMTTNNMKKMENIQTPGHSNKNSVQSFKKDQQENVQAIQASACGEGILCREDFYETSYNAENEISAFKLSVLEYNQSVSSSNSSTNETSS